ncbi:hypothetical protein P7C70_g6196, partial [Phenoliferia sp. Uapishka_3]
MSRSRTTTNDPPPTRQLRTAAERAPRKVFSPAAEATARAPKASKKKAATPKPDTKAKVGAKAKSTAKPRGRPRKAASPTPVAKKPVKGKAVKPAPKADSKSLKILANLHASIVCDHCHKTLETPRIFACQHTLCRKCITDWFDKKPTSASSLSDEPADEPEAFVDDDLSLSDTSGSDRIKIMIGGREATIKGYSSPEGDALFSAAAGEIIDSVTTGSPMRLMERFGALFGAGPSRGGEATIEEIGDDEESVKDGEEEEGGGSEPEEESITTEGPRELRCPVCDKEVTTAPIRSGVLSKVVSQLREAKRQGHLKNSKPDQLEGDDDEEGSAVDDNWQGYFPSTLGKRTRSDSDLDSDKDEDENEDEDEEEDEEDPSGETILKDERSEGSLSSVRRGKRRMTTSPAPLLDFQPDEPRGNTGLRI